MLRQLRRNVYGIILVLFILFFSVGVLAYTESDCDRWSHSWTGEADTCNSLLDCVYRTFTYKRTGCALLSGSCWYLPFDRTCFSAFGPPKTCSIQQINRNTSFGWEQCSCSDSSWSPVACGGGSCTGSQMQQKSNCGRFRCVVSATCTPTSTPTPTPTPIPIPLPPTGLTATCSVDGTSANLSWNASVGATTYPLRFNNAPNVPPASNCVPGDANWWSALSGECDNNTLVSTGYNNIRVVQGRTYGWWVHGANGGGYGPSTLGPSFTCRQPAPILTTMTQTCSGTTPAISMSWTGSGSFWADLGTDSAFGVFWNKNTGAATSTTGPTGFNVFPAGSPAMPPLVVGTTYYSRIWNGSHSNTRSVIINSSCNPPTPTSTPTPTPTPSLTPTPTPTPTPSLTPTPAPYYKLKDTSFYKIGRLSSVFPPGYTAYDISDDITGGYFNQGQAGMVISTGAILSAGANGTAISGSAGDIRNWTKDSYPGANPSFTSSSFLNYVRARKSITAVNDISYLPSSGTGGIYSLAPGNVNINSVQSFREYITIIVNGDLNLNTDDIGKDGIVFLVTGEVTINGAGSPATFNSSNRPFAVISAGATGIMRTLKFDNALTEANGLFVGNDIDFGSGAVPLKIVGNVSSALPLNIPFNFNRQRGTNQNAASLFIVFDPRHYTGIVDKISTTRSSWTQLQ